MSNNRATTGQEDASGASGFSGLSGSGPVQSVDTFRIPAERIPALAEAVRRAADEASRRLGWHPR